jgi:hypothetical protein
MHSWRIAILNAGRQIALEGGAIESSYVATLSGNGRSSSHLGAVCLP